MANTENKCANLPIEDHYNNLSDKDTLGLIYEKQKAFQEKLGYNFDEFTIKDIVHFWFMNKHALTDEIHEMFDALGGVDDGIGNAAWKPWKSEHKKTSEMKIKDLSKNDQLELFYEWIDGLHFFMNFAIAMGMTSEDIVNLYCAKMQENHDRQSNNY